MTDEQAHEVDAVYDNLAGLAAGDTFGHPRLGCSCGFSTTAPTWAEAGEVFDDHVAEIRASTGD